MSARKSEKMAIYVGMLCESSEMKSVLEIAKADIERSGQFSVMLGSCPQPKTIHDIQGYGHRHDKHPGALMAFFFDRLPEKEGYSWRLYNTMDASLIKGGTVRRGGTLGDWAHMIAHVVWKELMGASGPFATRLCYIKKVGFRDHASHTVCITDWLGNDPEVLFMTSRISIAPYWGLDTLVPSIYISEFTRQNVRLKKVDFMRRHRVVLDFDGTIVGISCATRGGDVAYGRSGGIWRYAYDSQRKKGYHILVIKELDVCSSPTIFPNGDILYGSGGKIKWRQAQTGVCSTLVDNGYCVGPAGHISTGMVVYSRRVKNTMQLCLYDMKTGKEEQITFDEGDKIDACWSPCGTWVAFCLENRGKGRIIQIHIKTRQQFCVSDPRDNCRFPAWSSWFDYLPHVDKKR